MGIQGLLPLLKSTMIPFHIKELQGRCVAVDTYSWLHKGALSCSTQLCNGLPTTRHIEYCMHRVNLLRHYGVKPILVFDGGLLPMKIEQENKRARSRKENLARAIEHESNGNSAAAYECYQKAVDISPSIAHEFIQVLKQEKVSYVVAPYEADAQMTYLAVSKQVDAIITEDSDLIPFGCPRIIFKMDKYGQGVEFQHSRLQLNKELSFAGFTHEMILQMCILSGCDYLQSLPGMGLKRAHALIAKFKSYDKVIKHLKYSTASVPPQYEEMFRKAILTFQLQRVYDPKTEDIVHLSDLADNVVDNLDFLGPSIPQHIAKGIAEGDLDPFTRMPFKVESVSSGVVLNRTLEFKPENRRKKLDLPLQKNLLTKYFCFASVEAKRKFRAPRTSPIIPSPADKSSPSHEQDFCVEANSNNIHGSLVPAIYSRNTRNTKPGDAVYNNLESSDAGEDLEFPESPVPGTTYETRSSEISLIQHGGAMIEPCQALLKECDSKHAWVPSAIQSERSTENKQIIVQSSYFKSKPMDTVSEDHEKDNLIVKSDPSIDPSNRIILKSSYRTRTEDNKIVVRSTYFQRKPINNNNQQERLFIEDDSAMGSDIDGNIILESASSNNNTIAMKRKASPNDTGHELQDNIKPKNMRADASISENGCNDANLDGGIEGTISKRSKFGSNISHLGRYSDIAEKSMERFVSVISSFKFSGSRASGLRAPLKEVRNTCTTRPNADVDFSRFAYTPNDKMKGVAFRRR